MILFSKYYHHILEIFITVLFFELLYFHVIIPAFSKESLGILLPSSVRSFITLSSSPNLYFILSCSQLSFFNFLNIIDDVL